jgi:hypothetical protein
MATFVGLHNQIYFAHLDLTGFANQVDIGGTRDMRDSTTFADGGWSCVKPGIIRGQAVVSGFQDFAADALDDELSIGQLGSQYPLTVIPNPTGTVTAGDAAWMSRGIVDALTPFSGAIGDMATFKMSSAFDTAVVQAKVAHPKAARTATGNGTAIALAGPTSAQKLYAALHVTAFSGFTNVVFKVQSDDNGGFSSATDRITFTTVTGTTHQWSSVAGDFSTETHHRVTWTVTGTGSVTFVCVFGVI